MQAIFQRGARDSLSDYKIISHNYAMRHSEQAMWSVNASKKYLSLSLTLNSFYRLEIVLGALLKIIYLVSLQERSLHFLQNRRARANCL